MSGCCVFGRPAERSGGCRALLSTLNQVLLLEWLATANACVTLSAARRQRRLHDGQDDAVGQTVRARTATRAITDAQPSIYLFMRWPPLIFAPLLHAVAGAVRTCSGGGGAGGRSGSAGGRRIRRHRRAKGPQAGSCAAGRERDKASCESVIAGLSCALTQFCLSLLSLLSLGSGDDGRSADLG